VENLSAFGIYPFSKAGRCYGLLFRIQRQAYVFGATERGFFYRCGIKINEYKPGKWEFFFAIRTRIGIAELMIKMGMKDAVMPVVFRGNRVRGAIHFSRTGCISFLGGSKHLKNTDEVTQHALPDSYQTEQGNGIDSY